ncbi:uncharacterized protein UHOD_12158 [Ustilago sp. UG-2017b]|nr:uncharacterized protein UHOD_12158 [Ustilago sp. UG-2017b]
MTPRGNQPGHLDDHIDLQRDCHGNPLDIGSDLSWDRMDVQEELESYEGTMHSNRGSGKERFLSRTGPTVGNDDEGENERGDSGDYQTLEGVDERVD